MEQVVKELSLPSSGRVLLVENEPIIAAMMADALAEHGFEVVTMRSAEDALRYLMAGGAADVLFTDIELGQLELAHMDGATLARTAREIAPHLSVIYTMGGFGRIDRPVPGAAIVRKPYGPDEACGVVARVSGRDAGVSLRSRPVPETAPASGYDRRR